MVDDSFCSFPGWMTFDSRRPEDESGWKGKPVNRLHSGEVGLNSVEEFRLRRIAPLIWFYRRRRRVAKAPPRIFFLDRRGERPHNKPPGTG
jgi:hypothetical protein